MTLQEWEDEKDRELDEQLSLFFRSADPPSPPDGFAARTMKAVRQAPLPEGRRPLHRPWMLVVGWTVLITAAAAATYETLVNQGLAAAVLSRTVPLAVRAGMQLLQSVHTSSTMFEVFATISRAVGHAMTTREASVGLMLMTLVGATALTLLNRLLFSEKESSSW